MRRPLWKRCFAIEAPRSLRPNPLGGIGGAALILLATFLAYGPALGGGMLWDDDGHVTRAALSSLHGLGRIWFEPGATQQYYPLLHTAFWLEHRWWGDAPVGYHLVNVCLHVGAAVLVVAIGRRLAWPGALLAGMIFALHPVAVESVAWISEQKNTLSAVFYLASALVYLRYDRERRPLHYWGAFALYVFALWTKTVTATLPAALLVLLWWQRGKLDGRKDVRPLVPWLVLGAGAGLFSAWMERNLIGAQGAEFSLTLLQRGLLAGRAIWFYLGKLVWPANLTFIYPRWSLDPADGRQYLYPAGVLGVGLGLCLAARKHRGPLAGALYFVGTLFPALGFVNVFPFIYSYVADHFQYLASLGIIVPLAAGFVAATQSRSRPVRLAAQVAAVVLLAGLGTLTWRQCHLYRDAETLYRTTLARNPDCWMAYNNLGNLLVKTPDLRAEAMADYAAALRLRPDYADAHNNLGNALAADPNRLEEAMAEYEAALKTDPANAKIRQNLGITLARTGRLEEALTEFRQVVRLDPGFAGAHLALALGYSQLGRTEEAAAEQAEGERLAAQAGPP